MIYIDHLTAFVKRCLDEGNAGVYFPQNKDYMCTKDMALWISRALDKKIYFDPMTGIGVAVLRHLHPTVKKAFGSLIYDMEDDRDDGFLSASDSVKESVTI